MPESTLATSSRLYVTNGDDNTVSASDPSTGNTSTTIPVGNDPHDAVFNGTYIYIANFSGGGISVIDPAINKVITTISTNTNGLDRLSLSSDKKLHFITDNSSVVYIVDTTTNTIIKTLTGFSTPAGVAENPSGTHLYVVNFNCCASGTTGWVSV